MASRKSIKYCDLSASESNLSNQIEAPIIPVIAKTTRNSYHGYVTRNSYTVDRWVHRILNTRLLGAVYEKDIEGVELFLVQGADPSATCRTYMFTAVHISVLVNSEEILLKLLNNKAKPFEKDRLGLTPIHYAAWYGHHNCLEILLKQINKYSINDIINKVVKNKPRCISECLKDSLDHNCCVIANELPDYIEEGSTALHLACQKVNLKCVEILLHAKANAELKDERNLTAFEVIGERIKDFHKDVEHSFLEILNIVKVEKHKAQMPSSRNYFTPTHAAVMLQSKRGIDKLIKEGMNYRRFDKDGETPIHLAIIKQLQDSLKALLECVDDISAIKNRKGFTPFQTAVERQWIQGVGLLLSANANVTEVAADGRTVLHVAAVCGNADLLEELLELEEIEQILNARNNADETPIFCAISSRNYAGVVALLNKNADINVKLFGNINVLHRVAEEGDVRILSELLKAEKERKLSLINELDTLSFSGLTPLHLACMHNHVDCVKELLEWNCDYKKRTSAVPYYEAMAIHLAANRGNEEVVKILLEHDSELLSVTDARNRNPLHYAALQGHRKCIEVLLYAGADLSIIYEHETALDMIFRSISRPTEFLETVFDNSINIDDENTPITDKHCMINIDFTVLIPNTNCFNQMKVLSNLLSSGNTLGQRRLLLHPLVESFLYLKWAKLNTIFSFLVVFYALFVIFLTIFVISLFYYRDDNRPKLLLDIKSQCIVLIIFLQIVAIPEALLAVHQLKQYTLNTEKCIKWISIILAIVLVCMHITNHNEKVLCHIATIALLSSWIEMMFLLSKFPTWGYYVQMFFKVSKNVLKVMTAFSFLVIGFALAFMIEFRGTEPFMYPLSGFIKTIVMMTSEPDYSGLFMGENIDNAQVINLSIYVTFLVLATVVLMNLMVGLAVSDIHDLEIIGKIDRHAQQIDFLSILESDTLARFLPQKQKIKMIESKCIPRTLHVYPSHPKCKITKLLPPDLKESVIDIAENNDRRNNEITLKQISKKIDRLTEAFEKFLNYKI